MRITVTIDDGAFDRAMDRYVTAMEAAALDANFEAAELIGRLTRAYLGTFSHPPATRTPSGPGMPPAWITGTLAASVQASREAASSVVGPTRAASSRNGPIGRALELGHFYTAHGPTGYMRWYEDGQWHRARAVTHPPHPYLKPMVELAVGSGMVSDVYKRRWSAAQAASV